MSRLRERRCLRGYTRGRMSSGRHSSLLDRRPLLAWGLLVGVVCVAAGLRVYALDRAPLWTDELFSLQSSWGRGFYVETLPREVVLDPAPDPTRLEGAGPIHAIYATQQSDTHPPLFFVILRIGREVLGDSVADIRLPSVVASLGLIVAAYAAVSVAAGRTAGLTAATLLALATPQIQFAQEAHGYVLAAMFVTGAAAALSRMQYDRPTAVRWVLLTGCAMGAVSTLYLAALPLLGLGVYSVLHLRGRTRRAVVWAGLAAGGLAAVVLGPLLLEQRQHLGHRNAWLVSETPRTLLQVGGELAAAGTLGQIAPLQDRSRPAATVAGGVLLILLVPLYLGVPATRMWVWMLLWSLLPLAAWDLLGNKLHLQQPRYTLLAGVALIGMVASCVSRVRSPVTLVPAALTALAVVSLPEAYRSTKEDWHLVRAFAQSHANPSDLYIVAAHGSRDWEHLLYLGLSRYARTADQRLAVALHTDRTANVSALRGAAISRGGVVIFSEYDTDVGPLIPQGWQRTTMQNVPSVGILQAFRPPAAAPSP